MKLKILPSIVFLPKGHEVKQKKNLLLVFVACIILLLTSIFLIPKTVNSDVNCDTLSLQAEKIFGDNGKDFIKVKKRYNEIKESAKKCTDKTGFLLSLQKGDATNLLSFYRNMAIASNSFGDYKEAKVYAAKALSYNEEVRADARENKIPKYIFVKAEMEAIQNGTY